MFGNFKRLWQTIKEVPKAYRVGKALLRYVNAMEKLEGALKKQAKVAGVNRFPAALPELALEDVKNQPWMPIASADTEKYGKPIIVLPEFDKNDAN